MMQRFYLPQSIPSASYQTFQAQNEDGQMQGGYLAPSYGKVEKQNDDATVDVVLQCGVLLKHIPVLTQDWASDLPEKSVGRKRLPPKGAYVLVMFPGGLPETGIVIGSYLDVFSEKQRKELIKDGEEKVDRSRNLAGWQEEYHQDTGLYKLTDDDDFAFTVDKKNKKIDLVDWHGNKLTIDENGIKWEDKNENKITQDSSGMKLNDKNGNKVVMGTTGVTINDNFEVLK